MSSGVSPAVSRPLSCLQGMPNWPRGSSLSLRRCRVRASGLAGSKDRAEPGRVSGAGGVLDAGAREPIIDACGERACGSRYAYAVVCAPRPVVRPGRPLAAFIPSFVPGTAGRGAWGGFASGPGGADQTGVRAAGPGGQGRWPQQGTECSAAARLVAGGRIAGGRAPGRGTRSVTRFPAVACQGGGRARRAGRRRPG